MLEEGDPDGIPWYFHRVLVSEHYTVSRQEAEEFWSLEDLLEANAVLDMIDAKRQETL